MSAVGWLPHATAALNALAGLLLCIGFALQRGRRLYAHRIVMTAAVCTSALFLALYLVHHAIEPLHPFAGQGLIRPVYFGILFSHVGLAALAAPLIALTFWRGRKAWHGGPDEMRRHRTLARLTFPLWLYVSVSGIGVYALLYHLYPASVT